MTFAQATYLWGVPRQGPWLKRHCTCSGKAGETLSFTPLYVLPHWGCPLKGHAGSDEGTIRTRRLCCLDCIRSCIGESFHAEAILQAFPHAVWGNETHVWEEQHTSSAEVDNVQFVLAKGSHCGAQHESRTKSCNTTWMLLMRSLVSGPRTERMSSMV